MDLSSGLRLDIEDDPSDADVDVLARRLEDFNESRWPGHQPWKPLGVFVRDEESVVPTAAGSSSAIFGCRTVCAAKGSGANSWAGARIGRRSAAATRRGSTRSAFKRPASIGSLAMRSSANSTGRRTTSVSSSRSDWRRARRRRRRQVDRFVRRTLTRRKSAGNPGQDSNFKLCPLDSPRRGRAGSWQEQSSYRASPSRSRLPRRQPAQQ